MYVNNQFVIRDVQTVSGFDMLPVLDIAGELGFNSWFDGSTIKLYNDNRSFTFTVGSASVYDENGTWYGLDVVPQIINGKVRVPAKFFQDAMGMSYTWDSVTNTIFMGSEFAYNGIVCSYDYQQAAKQKDLVQSARRQLNVPDDFAVTYKIGGSYYWDAGERYLTQVSFYRNDEIVAGALFDTYTYEIVRNIYSIFF